MQRLLRGQLSVALSSLERIDQSVRDLSPMGKLHTHGAGLLSAKRVRDAQTFHIMDTVASGAKRAKPD